MLWWWWWWWWQVVCCMLLAWGVEPSHNARRYQAFLIRFLPLPLPLDKLPILGTGGAANNMYAIGSSIDSCCKVWAVRIVQLPSEGGEAVMLHTPHQLSPNITHSAQLIIVHPMRPRGDEGLCMREKKK